MDVDTGELLTLSEWSIPMEAISDVSIVQRQVSSIEQELNYLLKLKHGNLVHYVNIRHDASEDKMITIQILQEFVYGEEFLYIFLSISFITPIKIDYFIL